MKYIIDRIEDSIAVAELEDLSTVDIPLSALPKGVKEGDVINVSIDENETQSRKESISRLMDDLFVD